MGKDMLFHPHSVEFYPQSETCVVSNLILGTGISTSQRYKSEVQI